MTADSTTMPAMPATSRAGRTALWTGRVLSALPTLFLLMDAGMKLAKPSFVVDATAKLGYSESVIIPLGIVLLICTLLYILPLTAVLGAVLLTGYLGAPLRATCATAIPCSATSCSPRTWAYSCGWASCSAIPACVRCSPFDLESNPSACLHSAIGNRKSAMERRSGRRPIRGRPDSTGP